MKRTWAATLVIAISFLILVSQSKGEEKRIKLGAMLDLSGEYAMQGSAFREGIELGKEEINSNGGLDGKSLEVIYEDTQYKMASVSAASNKLLTADKVVAAMIMTYTEIMTAGPIFENAKVPIISMWDSAPEIDHIGEYIFGIGSWTPSTTDVSSMFAREKLHAKTAAAIHSVGTWSESTSVDFGKKFEQLGGRLLDNFSMNTTDADFRAVILKVKNLKPDVLYAPIADNIPAFFKQVRQSHLSMPIIFADSINEELLKLGGKDMEGVYQTQAADPETAATKKMLDAYKKKFGKECTQVLITAWGFDAINLLLEAMRTSGTSPEAIKNGIYKIKNYNGASGDISITSEGSSRTPVKMFRVENGKLQKVVW